MSNRHMGMRMEHRQRQSMILSPQQLLVHKLLIAPALASAETKQRSHASTDTKSALSRELSRQVAALVKQEDPTSPLTDRQILAELQQQPKWHRVTTQDIARTRFALGLPPSKERSK